MRSLFPALLAASMLALLACGSSSKDEQAQPPANPNAAELQAKAELQRKRDAVCGNPLRFPVSDECLKMAQRNAPILIKQNDLTLAVWRNCALTPASAEAIRRETIAKGTADSAMGRRIIAEMERTEKNSDSPCVRADLNDPNCMAGDMNACAQARANDKACLAWFHDPDTRKRIQCLGETATSSVCAQAAAAEAKSDGGPLSDAQQLEDDCRRAQNACLHTFDECANAKDALDKYLAQINRGAKPGAPGQQPQPQTATQPQSAQP